MLQRTSKLFIGKDISRTAAVIDAAGMEHITLASHIADGEIVVLDKYKRVLAAGSTIADTDVIFICQGTGNTFSYAREDGTSVDTAARKVRLSDPINGKFIKNVTGKSYVAKAEKVVTFDLTAVTPVAGDEYILRIVYKDMVEHPGQFTHTYRVVADGTDRHTNLIDLMMNKVNAHGGRRVQATHTATTLVLTGLPIPGCTSTLTDFDKFSMVEFDPFLLFIDISDTANTGWQEVPVTSKTVSTALAYGSGNWEQIRDLERDCAGYLNITNRTHYPVFLPAVETVKSATYDIITIDHEADYQSPDNQYVKYAPLQTILAFVVPSSGTQEDTVLAVLNPWLASCPGSFDPISV